MEQATVRIVDPDLSFLSSILHNWNTCISLYTNFFDGEDLPYWYNERANVSVLAGAAWRSGFAALEEYQSKKLRPEGNDLNGRNDLYITNQHDDVYVEAKVLYADISEPTLFEEKARKALAEAVVDAKKLTEGERRVGAVFMVPYSQNKNASRGQISEFVGFICQFNCSATACCVPANSQAASSHDNRYYPAAALLLNRS